MKVDDKYYGNPSLRKMREVFANCQEGEATPCAN
jgi:hypothetical protein